MSVHRQLIGIRITRNSVGHFQMTITHLIRIEKIKNLASNSCSKYVLSKTFRPRLKIPHHSKVTVETVANVTFQHIF